MARVMVAPSLARIADRLNRCRCGGGDAGLPALILLTDARRLPDPLPALAGLPRGAAVILRHYGVAGRSGLARRLLAACRIRRLRLIIAADPAERPGALPGALAARTGAAGVHLPERLLGRAYLRRPGRLITAAAHGPAGLRRACRAGAAAALLSPVFATQSHPGARPLGPNRFAAWARRAPLPVYALGGIDARTARRLGASGAVGLAGVDLAQNGDRPRRRQKPGGR
jgi:thiamine-phosphate pyrophosphorylase